MWSTRTTAWHASSSSSLPRVAAPQLRASPRFPLRARRRLVLGFHGEAPSGTPRRLHPNGSRGRGETPRVSAISRRGASGSGRALERGGRAGVLAPARTVTVPRRAVGDGSVSDARRGRLSRASVGLLPRSLPRVHERSNRVHAFGVQDDERAGRGVGIFLHRLHDLEFHELAV